jgi:arylsulfatase A-like enzyme
MSAVLLLVGPMDGAFGAEKRPNFVLCLADDQGFGDVGYNSPDPRLQTPVLDEMARTDLRLDRFYSAAPVCSPTRGSFLTGRHPNRFGCFSWGLTIRPQELTLAEAMKRAGYRTGHFGKWHLGSVRASSLVSPGNSGFDTWVSAANFFDNDPLLSHEGTVERHHGEGSMVCMDEALKFIRDAAGRDEPFLAVIWFGSPHDSHHGSDELMKLYDNQGLTPAVQNYYAEITGIDRAMGKLRQALRDLKIERNTMLLYTTDNGPQGPDDARPGSAGPFSGRKAELLEGGIRVPAIIEWPGVINSPRSSTAACNSSDIYPTVLELAGVTVKNAILPLDGVSFKGLIEGSDWARDKPMGFWVYTSHGVRSRSETLLAEQRDHPDEPSKLFDDVALSKISKHYEPGDRTGDAAWIDGDWKLLIRTAKRDTPLVQLFNVVKDPAEKHDLSQEQPERVEKMRAELDAWQASVIHSLNGGDYQQ